jgi:hypothetical protein
VREGVEYRQYKGEREKETETYTERKTEKQENSPKYIGKERESLHVL